MLVLSAASMAFPAFAVPDSSLVGEWTGTIRGDFRGLDDGAFGFFKRSADITFTVEKDGTITGTGTGWESYDSGYSCGSKGRADNVMITVSGFILPDGKTANISIKNTVTYQTVYGCNESPGFPMHPFRAWQVFEMQLKDGATFDSGAGNRRPGSDYPAPSGTDVLTVRGGGGGTPDVTDPPAECGLTITPTLPPASDPRNLAKPSDNISYRLRVDWAGALPVSVNLAAVGGDGESIIPQFTFDQITMSATPTSVLMDVITRHAAPGTYPIVIGAGANDPDSGERCVAVTTVTLVVSEDSRAIALPLLKVDKEQGTVVIENPDQSDPEIRPGTKVKTGMEGNVDLSLDEGSKLKLGRETVLAIGEIKPEPDGTVDIVLPPNWVPDNMSYPPVDSEIFWKDVGKNLVEGHKRLAPQIAETAIACIGASLTGGVIGGLECGRQALFLLYNGQAYLTHEPLVEPNTTIIPGPGPFLVTPSAVGVPLSTEYSVETMQDGTSVFTVLEGPVWVMDVKSKAGIFLESYEQLAIPGTGNGLSEQELKERVIKLATASTYTWWTKSVKSQFQIGEVGLGKTWEDEYPYKPKNETTQFSDQDSVVYAWINFANVLPPDHAIDFKWHRPDGALYRSETKTIPATEAQYSGWSYYPLWSQLDLSDSSVTDRPGQWKVSILADGTLVKEIPFSIIKSTDGGGGCLIATAAFGSELTPQVQFLRDFRDSHILSTAAGSSFMSVFNTWYYSFSPHVADYEREQPWLQSTVKVLIYPLLGILTVSEKAYASIPGEYGAVTAGVVASSMMGAVYFWPAALAVQRFSKRSTLPYRTAGALIGATLAAVIVSTLAGSPTALMATTSFLVLTVIAVSALLCGQLIRHAIGKATNRMASTE